MSVSRSVTTAIAVLFIGAPLAAQNLAPAVVVPEPTTVVVSAPAAAPAVEVVTVTSQSPTNANASAGIRATASVASVSPAAAPQGRVGRNPALMIIGGVALIAGSLIDGDAGTIIMISGAAIGLYGLWQYLK